MGTSENTILIRSNNGEVKLLNLTECSRKKCESNKTALLPYKLIVAGVSIFFISSLAADGIPVKYYSSPPAIIRQSELPLNNLGSPTVHKEFTNTGINIATQEYRTPLKSMSEGTLNISHTVANFTNDDIVRREVDFKGKVGVVVNGRLVSQESGFKSFFGGFPLITFGDIKHEWSNFTDASSLKVIVLFFGTALTTVLGAYTILNQILFWMTVLHFIMRLMANKYKDKDNCISVSRAIQLFFWSYFLLAIGNQLSALIVLNGVAEGTFLAVVKIGIIFMDYKGSIEHAEEAKLPVPGFFKALANIKTSDFRIPL